MDTQTVPLQPKMLLRWFNCLVVFPKNELRLKPRRKKRESSNSYGHAQNELIKNDREMWRFLHVTRVRVKIARQNDKFNPFCLRTLSSHTLVQPPRWALKGELGDWTNIYYVQGNKLGYFEGKHLRELLFFVMENEEENAKLPRDVCTLLKVLFFELVFQKLWLKNEKACA